MPPRHSPAPLAGGPAICISPYATSTHGIFTVSPGARRRRQPQLSQQTSARCFLLRLPWELCQAWLPLRQSQPRSGARVRAPFHAAPTSLWHLSATCPHLPRTARYSGKHYRAKALRNERCGVPSPPRAWHTLFYRDPHPMCPTPQSAGLCQCPDRGQNPVPGGVARAMVGGQGDPKPTASLRSPSPPWGAAPLLPVHAWLSPLSSWQCWLCHPTPAVRATPEPAARVTACAAAHAQLGMVPVASPGPHGRGCHGLVLPGAPAGAVGPPSAMEPPERHWPQLAAFSLQVEPQPSPPTPEPAFQARHVASSWDCPLPVQATTPQKGMGAPWHVPPGWYVP